MAHLKSIFICPQKGESMQRTDTVLAVAGKGLVGDRYFLDKGTYSGIPNRTDKSKCIRHISLFSRNDFQTANAQVAVPFEENETRRNLLIDGPIKLLSLLGKKFKIGEVLMQGFEDCTPCSLPGKMANKADFEKAFKGRGGLRAEILTSGVIVVHHDIFVLNESTGNFSPVCPTCGNIEPHKVPNSTHFKCHVCTRDIIP